MSVSSKVVATDLFMNNVYEGSFAMQMFTTAKWCKPEES